MKRYFRDSSGQNVITDAPKHHNFEKITHNDVKNKSIMPILSNNDIIEILHSYDFTLMNIDATNIVPNAMGIGDILWNILHLQNHIWKPPMYINLFYFTNNYYYPNPKNALLFRLELLHEILSTHTTLNKSHVVFFIGTNYNSEQYNTKYRYDKLLKFQIDANIKFPEYNDNNYIIFHTKLRLQVNANYAQVIANIEKMCKNFKSRYKIYILGERYMPETKESNYVGITTIYKQLMYLKNHNVVIDKTIDNIYNNLDYTSFKSDISICKGAIYNIHIGYGGQFSFSLIFAKNIIQYVPNISQDSEINLFLKNPNLLNYKGFTNFYEFTQYVQVTCGLHSEPVLTQTITSEIEDIEVIRYISGGKLGDFIFQLGIIQANYLKTGKKGILYIADIGDKFMKGAETAYEDTEEFILQQPYIHSYHVHKGEQYDINLSSWREHVFSNNLNWYDLFYKHFSVPFGLSKWLENIPRDETLQNTIIVSHSLHRYNDKIDVKSLLNSYKSHKLLFVSLDENEYISFKSTYHMEELPHINCASIMELLIKINSCYLFIGNFSAPFTIAIALHKMCIGIPPTNNKHSIDLQLMKNMKAHWKHVTIMHSN